MRHPKPRNNSGKSPKHRGGSLVLKLAVHAAMGTAMGLGFCLLLTLTGRQDLVSMIAHSTEPKSTAILLIGFTSLVFAVGATLTGMVLMTMEER
jgi:hypothetical protein